jgi:hypothetical protein
MIRDVAHRQPDPVDFLHGFPTVPPPYAVPPSVIEGANEISQILSRLTNPACRLLTLVGPNHDVQKRLLLHVLTTSATAFRDGIFFVANQGNIGGSLLLDIAHSIGLIAQRPEDDFVQREDEHAALWLYKQLREQELLLVFDRIEHYSNRVTILEQILKRAPMIKIIVSTHEPLNSSIEWIFDIY